MFDENEDAVGFLTRANSSVYLYFSITRQWIGYFVRAKGNFNLFSLDGSWTGQYLCYDSEGGFNLFNSESDWTKLYAK